MKPLLPWHAAILRPGSLGEPVRRPAARAPAPPVLQRQRAPQQLMLDLRRR